MKIFFVLFMFANYFAFSNDLKLDSNFSLGVFGGGNYHTFIGAKGKVKYLGFSFIHSIDNSAKLPPFITSGTIDNETMDFGYYAGANALTIDLYYTIYNISIIGNLGANFITKRKLLIDKSTLLMYDGGYYENINLLYGLQIETRIYKTFPFTLNLGYNNFYGFLFGLSYSENL